MNFKKTMRSLMKMYSSCPFASIEDPAGAEWRSLYFTFIIILCTASKTLCLPVKPTASNKPIVNPIATSARAQTSYKEPRRSGRDARRKRNMQRRPSRTKQVQKKPHEKSPYRPFKKQPQAKPEVIRMRPEVEKKII